MYLYSTQNNLEMRNLLHTVILLYYVIDRLALRILTRVALMSGFFAGKREFVSLKLGQFS